MNTTTSEIQPVWRVWFRPNENVPWRTVGTAATKPVASKLMWDLCGGKPGGDWLVTAHDVNDPNARHASMRRSRLSPGPRTRRESTPASPIATLDEYF